MKQLVVYFSRVGENIINHELVVLKKGNTEVVAEQIANLAHADIYKIEPVEPYPFEYETTNQRAKEEFETNKSSAIKGPKVSLNDYDVIYLGFPIWYRTFPTIIARFIREHDFVGKTIKPFCTNDEGMFGTAEMELQTLIAGGTVKSGLAIHGSKVNNCQNLLKDWIEK